MVMRIGNFIPVVLLVSFAGAQAPVVTKETIDKWMTEISNSGRWGKEDHLGTYNLLTPAKRKQALGLVKEGFAVSMAHPLEREKSADNPRPLGTAMTYDGEHAMDLYSIWYHGSTITHIDALCHYSQGGKAYNGFSTKEASDAGCGVLGIDNQREGVMTRGILVDIPRMKGVDYLEPNVAIYPADLEAWEKYAGIKIGSGDAVFLRTGRWARRAKMGPWNVARETAGFHASVMPWFKKRDIALLGNDSVNDVQPSGITGVPRPIHQLSIIALGMPLIDVMDLEAVAQEAAKRKRWEFLVTLSAPPVPGGTGFPINPVATF